MECRLFRCESALLRSHWVMVIMNVFTRRLVGFGVERGPVDGLSVCRLFNSAIAGQPLPNRLSTDHDPLFRFHRWLANLRVLDIEEIKSVPYTPSHIPSWNASSARYGVNIWITPSSGIRLTSRASWKLSATITMLIAYTARFREQRQRNRPGSSQQITRQWMDTLGDHIAAVCLYSRSQPKPGIRHPRH